MKAFTLRAIPANGGTLLRSDLAQDRTISPRTMFDAVQAQHADVEWPNAFRTFDGGMITQFFVPRRIAADYTDLSFS